MRYLRLPPDLLPQLCALHWPGNVRELENTIEMLVALLHGGDLDLSLLPGAAPEARGLTLRERVDAYERGVVVEALRAARGNKAEAARALGIGRVTLYEKLAKYGVVGE